MKNQQKQNSATSVSLTREPCVSSLSNIAEIFTSIQGEGPYVGVNQMFIRFCGCNLNCNYCDTEHEKGISYTVDRLLEKINSYDLSLIHSISLTGGEPLLWADFLKEFLPKINKIIYLETNAILPEKYKEIAEYVDIVSADIKLPSTTGMEEKFTLHDKFFEAVRQSNKEIFAKIVFDENITEEEIKKCTNLAQKYDIELILQPKTVNNKISVSSGKITENFEKFIKLHAKTRLIPQVHKFLKVN